MPDMLYVTASPSRSVADTASPTSAPSAEPSSTERSCSIPPTNSGRRLSGTDGTGVAAGGGGGGGDVGGGGGGDVGGGGGGGVGAAPTLMFDTPPTLVSLSSLSLNSPEKT